MSIEPDAFYGLDVVRRLPRAERPVATSTLYRWMDAGRFPQSMRTGPNIRVWRGEDLLEWLADPTSTLR